MEAREALLRIRELSSPLEPVPVAVAPALPPLPGIRAVVFDVYGTLFMSASGEVGTEDTGPDGAGAGETGSLGAAPADATAGEDPGGAGTGGRGGRELRRARRRAFAEAFAACGAPVPPEASRRAAALLPELIRAAHDSARARGIEFPEVEIRHIFRRLLEALAGEALIRGVGTGGCTPGIDIERLALEYECRANPTWPMPGARAVLEGLHASGRALGLVSNAQFYTPWLFAAHLGLEPAGLGIDEGLCAWSYRLGQAKPSASVFTPVLGALAARGIAATEVLYVGNDRRNDVWPAARLGWRTALFAGDRRSFRPREGDPQLAGVRPDALITELGQLTLLLSFSTATNGKPR